MVFEAALNLTVLLWEWFLLYQWICAYCVFWHKSAEARFVRVFVCVGGPAYVHTCVLSGSRATAGVLAFSLKKKKENVFKPFYPSHCKTSALPQLCVGLALTSCFTIGLLPLRLLLPLFTICCLSHVYRLIPPWLRLSWTPGRSQQKLTGLLTSISGPLHSCLHS